MDNSPEETGRNVVCSQSDGAVTSKLISTVLESALTPGCFSIDMYTWKERNVLNKITFTKLSRLF